MKRFLKIFGISFGALLGIIGIIIGFAALTGKFSNKPVYMTKIFFEGYDDNIDGITQREDRIYNIIVGEREYKISYEPQEANNLMLDVFVEGAVNAFEPIPTKVKAGVPFTISPKKNGENYVSGSICLKFSNARCPNVCHLNIASDSIAENKLTVIDASGKVVSKDCFETVINKDKNFNDLPGTEITQSTQVSSSTSNVMFNLVNSKPKIIWINSVYSDILDIDTGSVFPYNNDNSSTSKLKREVKLELVETNKRDNIDVPISNIDIELNYSYINNQRGYMAEIIPKSSNNIKQFNLKMQMHRSFAIQDEFNRNGFNNFKSTYLLLKGKIPETDREWSQLQADLNLRADYNELSAKYLEFLEKYKNYFNSTIINQMLSKNISGSSIQNIVKSLDDVFITQYQTYRILDFDIESFTIDSKDLKFNVFDEKTVRLDDIISSTGEFGFNFNISIKDENLSTLERDNLIYELKKSFEVEVYVKGLSSKDNKKMGLINSEDATIDKYSGSKGELLDVNNFADYTSDQKYFYATKTNDAVTFSANVPSKSGDFSIVLAFIIKAYAQNGKETHFYNFVDVVIDRTPVEGELQVDANQTMYINTTSINSEYATQTQGLKYSGLTNVSNSQYNTVAFFVEEDSNKISENLKKIETLDDKSYSFCLENNESTIVAEKCSMLGTISYSNGNQNAVKIKALNASQAPVNIFAVLLLTDKNGNPIDRDGNIITDDTRYFILQKSASKSVYIKSIIEDFFFYTPVKPITKQDESEAGAENNDNDKGTNFFYDELNSEGKMVVKELQADTIFERTNRSNKISTSYTRLKLINGNTFDNLIVTFSELDLENSKPESYKFGFEKEGVENKESLENNYFTALEQFKVLDISGGTGSGGADNSLESGSSGNSNSTYDFSSLFQITVNDVSPELVGDYISVSYEELKRDNKLIGVKIILNPKKNCEGVIKLNYNSDHVAPLSQSAKNEFGRVNFIVQSIELTDVKRFINYYYSNNDYYKEKNGLNFNNNNDNFSFYGWYGSVSKIWTSTDFELEGSNKGGFPEYARIGFLGIADEEAIVDETCFSIKAYQLGTNVQFIKGEDGQAKFEVGDKEYYTLEGLRTANSENYFISILDPSNNNPKDSLDRIMDSLKVNIEEINEKIKNNLVVSCDDVKYLNQPQIRVVYYAYSPNGLYGKDGKNGLMNIFEPSSVSTVSYKEIEEKKYYRLTLQDFKIQMNQNFVPKNNDENNNIELIASFEYDPSCTFSEGSIVSTVDKKIGLIFEFEECYFSTLDIEDENKLTRATSSECSLTLEAGEDSPRILFLDTRLHELGVSINKISGNGKVDIQFGYQEAWTVDGTVQYTRPEGDSYRSYKVYTISVGGGYLSSDLSEKLVYKIVYSFRDGTGVQEYTVNLTVTPDKIYAIGDSYKKFFNVENSLVLLDGNFDKVSAKDYYNSIEQELNSGGSGSGSAVSIEDIIQESTDGLELKYDITNLIQIGGDDNATLRYSLSGETSNLAEIKEEDNKYFICVKRHYKENTTFNLLVKSGENVLMTIPVKIISKYVVSVNDSVFDCFSTKVGEENKILYYDKNILFSGDNLFNRKYLLTKTFNLATCSYENPKEFNETSPQDLKSIITSDVKFSNELDNIKNISSWMNSINIYNILNENVGENSVYTKLGITINDEASLTYKNIEKSIMIPVKMTGVGIEIQMLIPIFTYSVSLDKNGNCIYKSVENEECLKIEDGKYIAQLTMKPSSLPYSLDNYFKVSINNDFLSDQLKENMKALIDKFEDGSMGSMTSPYSVSEKSISINKLSLETSYVDLNVKFIVFYEITEIKNDMKIDIQLQIANTHNMTIKTGTEPEILKRPEESGESPNNYIDSNKIIINDNNFKFGQYDLADYFGFSSELGGTYGVEYENEKGVETALDCEISDGSLLKITNANLFGYVYFWLTISENLFNRTYKVIIYTTDKISVQMDKNGGGSFSEPLSPNETDSREITIPADQMPFGEVGYEYNLVHYFKFSSGSGVISNVDYDIAEDCNNYAQISDSEPTKLTLNAAINGSERPEFITIVARLKNGDGEIFSEIKIKLMLPEVSGE